MPPQAESRTMRRAGLDWARQESRDARFRASPRNSRDGHRFYSLHRPPCDLLRRNHPAVLPNLARRSTTKRRQRFRSGDRSRPRRRSGDAAADQGQFSPTRHRRRGIRQRARRCRICLGAGSDRRHQILHRGLSDLGHADRAAAPGHAGIRHDASALYRRALFRRQRLGRIITGRPANGNWRCGAAPR